MVTSASNREPGVSIAHNQAPDLRVFVSVGRMVTRPWTRAPPPEVPPPPRRATPTTRTLSRTTPETLEP
jgi:hypothetical protein